MQKSGAWSIFRLKRLALKPYGLAFRGEARSFRVVWAGLRCAAASHVAFFKGNMLYLSWESRVSLMASMLPEPSSSM